MKNRWLLRSEAFRRFTSSPAGGRPERVARSCGRNTGRWCLRFAIAVAEKNVEELAVRAVVRKPQVAPVRRGVHALELAQVGGRMLLEDDLPRDTAVSRRLYGVPVPVMGRLQGGYA